MKSRRSRLTRTSEKQSKKALIVYGIVTILIIFLFLKYGLLLIGQAGVLVSKISGGTEQDTTSTSAPIIPPTLDPTHEATHSATIQITGNVYQENGILEVFANNSLYKKLEIEKDTFDIDVDLKSGENTIKAKVVQGKNESEFSEELVILYTKDAPDLEISFPSDGATFKRADQQIDITGKTSPDTDVTVNGFKAIVDNEGNYSYLLGLKEGENTITVEAINAAGLSTKKEIKVKFENN